MGSIQSSNKTTTVQYRRIWSRVTASQRHSLAISFSSLFYLVVFMELLRSAAHVAARFNCLFSSLTLLNGQLPYGGDGQLNEAAG